MSKNEETLSDIIKSIEKNAKPENMEIIYKQLDSLSKNEEKIRKHLPEVCKLINLIGTYLVKGEGYNTTESQLIFDTFCDLNFMKLLLKYSSFDFYEINLEIIKTFSFLLINIKSNTYLYYFFSKNLLNKIINKDYSKYDEEFLSYYVNFLKSLSLRLDEVSVNLFYIEKTNSFPIIENVLKLYNHRDSMVRNVVRNIVLNILKINCPNIQDHFAELPSISYLANIACHLRDICIQINDEIGNKKTNNLQYLYDDLMDEATYIDDLLNLNLSKINYIIINCIFYYLILPIICGAISEKTNRISKKVALFLIIFFFVNMKNEIFKNCLFALLFFDQLSLDLELFFVIPPEKNNYSFYPEKNKYISFCQFISENYSSKFLLTMIENDNIIYNRYKNKYPQIGLVMQKCQGTYQQLKNSNKKVNFLDIKDYLEMAINSFFSEEESDNMSQYHRNMSMSTGLGVGQFSKESTGEIYNICFLCYINQIFVELRGGQKKENSSYLSLTKNIIKDGLVKIIENFDKNNLEMILLINMLIFVVQSKDVNIANNLLRHVGLENIREKEIIKNSLGKIFNNYIGNKKSKDDSPLSELCFMNNDFNYINDYFFITKDAKNKLINNIKLPLSLSAHLLIKYEQKENNNENKEENKFINPYLLPITYKLILLNIMNLCLNSENKFELKKGKNDYDSFINNIEAIYKQILGEITKLLKEKKEYREDGYNKFYKKWIVYKKSFDNKFTIELIKDQIMNTPFLLLPEEYEKSDEEEFPKEILRKSTNNKDKFFDNCLLVFMMLQDLREILRNDPSFFRGKTSFNLIKNNFPLNIKKDDISDFNIGEEYNLIKINPSKIIRQTASYKLSTSENFEEGELILFNKDIYFAKVLDKNLVKINLKYKLKSIGLYKNKDDENNMINILIQTSENYEEKYLENENRDEDENKDNNIYINIKFEDEKTKEEMSQKIYEKIISINNEERLAFDGYFNEMNNNIKDLEEDF